MAKLFNGINQRKNLYYEPKKMQKALESYFKDQKKTMKDSQSEDSEMESIDVFDLMDILQEIDLN